MGLIARLREATAASTQPQLQRGAPRKDGATQDLSEAVLKAQARKSSAVIKRKNDDGSTSYKFPIPDAGHAKVALALIDQSDLTPDEKVTVRKAAYAKLGVKTDDQGKPVKTREADTGAGNVADPSATGDCQLCGGSGQWDDGDGDSDQCPLCDGTGQVDDGGVDPDDLEIREAASATAALRLITGLREAERTTPQDKPARYRVTLLEEGLGNPDDRNYYTKQALRDAVQGGLFDGLQAYADHPSASEERDRPERSVRDLVGHYENAAYREAAGRGRVEADFVPIEGDAYTWLVSLVEAAIAKKNGVPLAGISIDGGGTADPGTLDRNTVAFAKGLREGDPVNFVREISVLPSADIVTRPGAGGQFQRRLLESLRTLEPTRHPGTEPKEVQMKAAQLQQEMVAATAKLREAASDEKLTEAQATEAINAAITKFDELGKTEVEREVDVQTREVQVPAKPDGETVPVTQFRETERRAEKAESELSEEKAKTSAYEKNLLIGKVLRESKLPDDEHKFVIDDMRKAEDEDAMNRVIALHKERDEVIARRVRESLGSDRVEGFPARLPAGESGGRSVATDLGIDPDELKPAEDPEPAAA